MVDESLIIFEGANLTEALKKIDANNKGFLVCVDNKNFCVGVLTDGDVRRHLISKKINKFMSLKVNEIMNKNFDFRYLFETKPAFSNQKIKFQPVLDEKKRLIKIDLFDGAFWIGNRKISDGQKPFIIGEIGNNHNGELELGKKLVRDLKSSGADCAKFQMRNMSKIYSKKDVAVNEDLSTQYTKDLLSKYQLSNEDLLYLFEYTKDIGLIPLCTPWDEYSLDVLYEAKLPAIKIASADLTNNTLISLASQTNLPLICSTGMSQENEIKGLIRLLEKKKTDYALLHCNSTYPTPFQHINLNYISRLKSMTNAPIGYSGHERNIYVSIAACALGATIIERHITNDTDMEGPDHKASLVPSEFKKMIEGISHVYESLGNSDPREISQAEMINRHNLAKSVTARKNIKKGEKITRSMLEIRSPGTGIPPNQINKLVGLISPRKLKEGDNFYLSDLEKKEKTKLHIDLKHKIGIPIRYHDYNFLSNILNFDLIEFHLTYNDLKVNPRKFIKDQSYDYITVHAPELFANDHILDLASSDESYHKKSIENFKKTLDVVMLLKDIFSIKNKIPLIVNCGGFSKNNFFSEDVRIRSENRLIETVEKIDKSEIIFCAQTMPPFPWHFGGQQFHNLLRTPEEIIKFCKYSNSRICLDTSHTMMSSKFFGFDFLEAVNVLKSFISHIHLSDSKGVDQEGIALGEGDVPLVEFKSIVDKHFRDVSVIIETWQGHLNSGHGFIRDLKTWINIV